MFPDIPRSSVLFLMGLLSLITSRSSKCSFTTNALPLASPSPESSSFSSSSALLPHILSSSEISASSSVSTMEDRLRKSLWSFFAGDALAAPTHWFYGGSRQIQQYYGRQGITGYVKPSFNLAGSILNKSDPNGGGRATTITSSSLFGKGNTANGVSIIGDVINHGKLEYWSPNKQIHYHATLQAGENTLEAQLARLLMRSIVQTGGVFDENHFRSAYVEFMQRPGSHNDCYASTCHRMFFANLRLNKLDPVECPDNDGHNVDTIDGLVLPTIVSLAVAASRARRGSIKDATLSTTTVGEEAAQQAKLCARVTRKSSVLDRAAEEWGKFVAQTLWYGHDQVTKSALQVAQSLGVRKPRMVNNDEMTACYLSSAMPALLDNIMTHHAKQTTVWDALLMNANTGGENVHRGSCLGAILGAMTREVQLAPQMIQNLHHREDLEREINDFVAAVLPKVSVPVPDAHQSEQDL